jgi:bacterioferritin
MSAVQTLIDGLNQDLAAEYQAVIMYRTYASLVSGPYRQDLKSFFEGKSRTSLPMQRFWRTESWRSGERPRSR